jgi:putative CocE/NonD family hydrolase
VPPLATTTPPVAGTPAPTAPVILARAMIPMRDGIKLETVIARPTNTTKPLPLLLSRGPYGVPKDEMPFLVAGSPVLDPDGYIMVEQNVRGRFRSEGTFVMGKPPRDPKDPNAVDEITDAYDTIDWLLANVPDNSGRVAMLGTSYSAWTATMALIGPHPALKTVVERASPADLFVGDDFFHNGTFRLAYGFEYTALLESKKGSVLRFPFDRRDLYDFYLAVGPLSNADARYFHGKIPTWNAFTEHPNRDGYWQQQAFATHLRQAPVPVLNVGGWWDEEDFYGPQKIYELLERQDAAGRNHVVLGPWNHGGWDTDGRKLAGFDFGSDTGAYYRDSIQRPWLARWLHDKEGDALPEATVFETGTNRWRAFDRWPPHAGVTRKRLYLRAGGRLSFDAPTETGEGAADTYVSDPAHPVPSSPRPFPPVFQAGSEWPIWEVRDQRFVDGRPDVLTFTTDVLDRNVTIAGDVVSELYASTSGTDSDWIVKLIDVNAEGAPPPTAAPEGTASAPDLRGYELMIAGDVVRARFRDSFVSPSPVPANKIVKYVLDLHGHAHSFLKGHRIMVQIQSSWFPVYDRNPQTFVDSIFHASAQDFHAATQRVFRSQGAPSAVVLPVLAE